MKNQLPVDHRGYETRRHGEHDFPVKSERGRISNYIDSRFYHHWHKDPEFTVINEGEMYYQINDKIYLLKRGMGVFVNSNALHSGWNQESECIYSPTNFDPLFFFGGKENRIFTKYVEPVVNSVDFAGLVFDPEKSEEDARIIEIFTNLTPKLKERSPMYELDIVKDLYEAWMIISSRALEIIEGHGAGRSEKQLSKIKKAIDYVENNYSEQITLSDLASVCCMSESALCRSFKSIMRQTPMEYIAAIRINKSLPLLATHEYSVTEISEKCGFSGSSYFAETFKRYMNCTPSQYAIKSLKEK